MDVTEGMTPNGILIINTSRDEAAIKQSINFAGKIFIVDASKIAMEVLGSPHTNTAMLGAVEKSTNYFGFDSLKAEIKNMFIRKLGEQGVQKNIAAIERAYSEVKQC